MQKCLLGNLFTKVIRWFCIFHFTLTFTFTVTPIMLFLGLLIALGVNAINRKLKGLIIFFSLLPMIVTPLIGSIILFWMIDSRGIVGNFLQIMFDYILFFLELITCQ